MFAAPEPSKEIVEWLSSLRLSHYAPFFHRGGYKSLEDCMDLTEESLLELKVLPTGHRRRILRSLEALGFKQLSGGEDESEEDGAKNLREPVPYPRHIFLKDRKRGASCQQPKEQSNHDLEASQSLPPGAGLGEKAENLPRSSYLVPPRPAPRNPKNIQKSAQTCLPASACSNSSSESLSASERPDREITTEDPLHGTNSIACSGDDGGFQGEMVENSIYEGPPNLNPPVGQRLSRSYKLRHRPVPEIPNPTTVPLQDRYCS